ncbi:MAG: DUF4111 domain-containing protein [Anaerolineae bacterium]|nr:DUF4111 domain-containing protein [Anaerolineae bacterium]
MPEYQDDVITYDPLFSGCTPERPLPAPVAGVARAFVSGLEGILGHNLYGVYMYGAALFPNTGPVQDIDCHVIVRDPLTGDERDAIARLYADLGRRFPVLGRDLDAYFILLEEAQGFTPPTHQLNPVIVDSSWALHCAHVRAGCYLRLYGPEPAHIFPQPSWRDIAVALDHELQYVAENLQYPAYCILNLCRILYSYTEKAPVVSKQFCGRWARRQFPQWEPPIRAASRHYDQEATGDDSATMNQHLNAFLDFAIERINELKNHTGAGQET